MLTKLSCYMPLFVVHFSRIFPITSSKNMHLRNRTSFSVNWTRLTFYVLYMFSSINRTHGKRRFRCKFFVIVIWKAIYRHRFLFENSHWIHHLYGFNCRLQKYLPSTQRRKTKSYGDLSCSQIILGLHQLPCSILQCQRKQFFDFGK